MLWHGHVHVKDPRASEPWRDGKTSLPPGRLRRKWQCLPWGTKCECWQCVQKMSHSFFPSPDSYGLETAPQQRSLLQRRAKPVPLIWLWTITLSLFNSIYWTLWASGCWGFPSREPRPPGLLHLSFFFSFIHRLSQIQVPGAMLDAEERECSRWGNCKWGRGVSGCIHF